MCCRPDTVPIFDDALGWRCSGKCPLKRYVNAYCCCSFRTLRALLTLSRNAWNKPYYNVLSIIYSGVYRSRAQSIPYSCVIIVTRFFNINRATVESIILTSFAWALLGEAGGRASWAPPQEKSAAAVKARKGRCLDYDTTAGWLTVIVDGTDINAQEDVVFRWLK